MTLLEKGQFSARFAQTKADLRAAQALRHRAFFGRDGVDRDAFDGACEHVLLERRRDEALLGGFRINHVTSASGLAASYSSQAYDLTPLKSLATNALEISRFCLRPDLRDADVMRLGIAAMARIVEDRRIGFLFGCASFSGTDPDVYADGFAYLRAHHLGDETLRPQRRLADVVDISRPLGSGMDAQKGIKQLPPLLRSYLAMGAWVGDHGVIDADMGTIHVFTGLEVAKVPAARALVLRALAA